MSVLLAALTLALIACTAGQEPEVPPCTPLEGAADDPCESDAGAALAQFSAGYSNARSSEFLGYEPFPCGNPCRTPPFCGTGSGTI